MLERKLWGRRVSIFVLATGLASLPAAALGQDEAAPPDPASLSSQPDVLNGLSSSTSGRVGGATLRSYGADIAAGPVPGDAKEASVSSVASKAVTPQPVGQLDLELLESEVAAKFNSLDHCRLDVARKRQVPPAVIVADTLTLRWTIIGSGYVVGMEVVGSTPVDAEVLDCIKREANDWRFTAPVGGDLRVERTLVHRPLL
jgi:hypothetical protein